MTSIAGHGAETDSRADRLLTLLAADPDNLSLIADAADAALAERRPAEAAELMARYAAAAPLPPREAGLAGLAALQLGRFEAAAAQFGSLTEIGVDDPAVRFNLAWSRAMLKDHAGALALIDEPLARELPQAAMLKVQLLHEQGAFDEAASCARDYIERHPDHRGLMAAVSVLALDVEDEALAARCAGKAGDHPDALTTLGTLALGEERATEALDIFERALARNANVPRAWVGLGLAKLLSGQPESAAADIDRGAEMFGDHLGSWIASGWTYFVNKDLVTSRARFEHALALDPKFAESHGALAVLDILDGRTDEGRARSEVALRLDRNCYSGALAKVLLASAAGDAEQARRIYDIAINAPIDGSGRTIAQALAKLGLTGS
jgi:tetratricopeptide (TPR) repeat protein